MRAGVAALALAALGGCATHRLAPRPSPIARGPAYVDLEAGWRVRVVTPILRSGRF